MLLAIETSCDESAVALFDAAGQLVADLVSSQVDLHRPYGGVVPELAARAHLENLPLLLDEVEHRVPGYRENLRAIAVTQGPGLKGCLLVGVSFAKGLAYRLGVPLIPVNHLEGHLMAGSLLPADVAPTFPFLALLVSGGHTQLVLVRSFRDYSVVAETRDDAVGEAFDKCATLLQLPYPGGPALSKAAENGNDSRFPFPVGLPHEQEGFSFSGLKTAFSRVVRTQVLSMPGVREDLAASIERALVDSLVPKTLLAAQETAVQEVLLTGGVAANRRLRQRLETELTALGKRCIVLPSMWCGDNAAMIGIVGRLVLQEKPMEAESESWHRLDALPRYPLEQIR